MDIGLYFVGKCVGPDLCKGTIFAYFTFDGKTPSL